MEYIIKVGLIGSALRIIFNVLGILGLIFVLPFSQTWAGVVETEWEGPMSPRYNQLEWKDNYVKASGNDSDYKEEFRNNFAYAESASLDSCPADLTGATGADNVEVYLTSMSSTGSFSTSRSDQASVSGSGSNEITMTYSQLTNNRGADISDGIIHIKSVGYWSQTYFNQDNYQFTYNPEGHWEATADDGSLMTITPLSAADGSGTSYPIELFYFTASSGSGYFPNDGTSVLSNSFTDGGTGRTYSSTETLATPTYIPTVRLGYQPNGAVINNLVITLGLDFADGRDAFVPFSGDGGASDVDIHVYASAQRDGAYYDYGDVPGTYGDARHDPDICMPALYIGDARPDMESGSNSSTDALGDNTGGAADDDEDGVFQEGVLIQDQIFNVGDDHVIVVNTNNNRNTSTFLSAWIDFNDNGVFDTGEQIADDISVAMGSGTVDIAMTVPNTSVEGETYARFRICDSSGDCNTPTGTAASGEVEDYRITIEGATISGRLYLDTNGNGVEDGGEFGLANVDVIITDSEGNMQTVTSDANGNWTADVLPGSTIVDVDETDPDFPSGYTQTEGDDPTMVTVTPGVDNDGGTDGYYLAMGSISGVVTEDTDPTPDGIGDAPLVGVVLELLNEDGTPFLGTDGNPITTTTDNMGNYTFGNLPTGNYQIREQDPDGYFSVGDTDGGDPNVIGETTPIMVTDGIDTPANNFVDRSNFLPVEFLYFNVAEYDKTAKLDWATATEINNSHFEVERSMDSETFQSIGRVAGAGNMSTVRYYSFDDTEPIPGNNFYRLKQVDFDGTYTYSRVQRVSIRLTKESEKFAVNYFPNPVSNILTAQLVVNGLSGDGIYFDIIDTRGVQVMRLPFAALQNLDVSELSVGVYSIQVISETNEILDIQQFVKIK